ncbi:MAG: hypothetical protein JO255_11970 [Alphaproteobacteria bacterium]|nr:hypothetical protein [Alphaproteobacteria bacterium]
MPAKATKKAWEALKPKLGADKIWRDSHVGDSLTTWEKHYTFCEAESKKIGAQGQVSNIGPTLTIMSKFHVELPKSMQTVHDKLNSIAHNAARKKVQAFKAFINQDFAQVDAWHKAEQRADKAQTPLPPTPPLQKAQHGTVQKPLPVPPPTPMKAKATPPAPPPRQGATVKPLPVPPPTPLKAKATPPAPPPKSAKPGAKPKAPQMAGTAPDRGPPPPVPPFNRPSGQK